MACEIGSPSIKELAETYGVSVGTAHRAAGLLRQWGLLSESGRGKRPLIMRHAESEDLATRQAKPPSDQASTSLHTGGTTMLDLDLVYLSDPVKSFTAHADPDDPAQLQRLLRGAARRHGGRDFDVDDYELIVRIRGSESCRGHPTEL